MRTRRVVFLEPYPHVRGGAQVTNEILGAGLPEYGWTTSVVAPADGPGLDGYRAAGVPVTILDAGAGLQRYGGSHGLSSAALAARDLPRWWLGLRRHLRGMRADLFDVFDQRGIVLGAPAALLARVPLVWHVQSPGPSNAIDALGRRVARRVVVASNGVARRVGAPRTDLVPLAPVRLPDPIRVAGVGEAPRIVTAARIHPVKGFDVLIEAAAQLAPRHPGLRVEIYGDPQAGHEDYRDALIARVQALGLQDIVRFEGHVTAPWERWGGARVYVQPSRSEPFGIALVEAMGAGLPVVATAVDGPSDILDDGVTGLLVAPDNAAGLAEALGRVIADDALAARLAAAGQEVARREYTPANQVRRTAAAFDAALA